jgi:poly-gamma-glutamate synthesis protein (capsule biosynthesis protein)
MIQLKQIPNRIALLISAVMIAFGGGLLLWLLFNLPPSSVGEPSVALAVGQTTQTDMTARQVQSSIDTLSATHASSVTIIQEASAVSLVLAQTNALSMAIEALAASPAPLQTGWVTAPADSPTANVRFAFTGQKTDAVYAYTFAAATRFDTIETAITWPALQAAWRGNSDRFSAVAVLTATLPALTQLLGKASDAVVGYGTQPEVVAAAWANPAGSRPALVLLPFEQLEARLIVLTIDGQNPVENANKFDPATYPLVATLYAENLGKTPAEQTAVQALLAALPAGNRNPKQLTVIAMTGVTAMVRLTAEQMDQRGVDWLAEVVGPELASADITVISNEVPFVPGCETNTDMGNLTFCSKPEYLDALRACGVDLIGLTGNHQNDYGRDDAAISLDIYEEAGLPVYGGGRNKAEAFAPLYREHNGNRLAFLGANSYGPTFAWATDDLPGSAQFDLNIMWATIRNIKERGRAAVVLAELQYQESYEVTPLLDQRDHFKALVRAGADIVTGVQSHVPQAMEFTDGKLVLYGLGNLFFDQMWSQATREGMIVKHTIYNNRHLSTQVLTTLLYDYGQPRWTTPEERTAILQRVYGASYWGE